MGIGGSAGRMPWRWVLLALLVACTPVSAQVLELARLSPSAAAGARVVEGQADARFERVAGASRTLYEDSHAPTWWRVSAPEGVPARGEPQLLLDGPYLTQVEAWVPGARGATTHAIYGPHADLRYSSRALVIALPRGLAPGEPVYLRVVSPAAVPMALSVQPRDAVHRADLAHVGWRTLILSSMVVLALLALAFWAGVGERSFVFLALTLGFASLYIAAMGGEARMLPWTDALFGRSPQGARVVACLGVVSSNAFMRMYLELRRIAPALDRVLWLLACAMGVLAVVNLAADLPLLAMAGNMLLVASALAVFAAGAVASLRGVRAARFLLVSWLPLIVFSILKALQLSGVLVGAAWFSHALAASFALAGLLLTIGLSDKLLQLRRARDAASREASIDPLTGAMSRGAIERTLQEQVSLGHATGRALCVAFVDVDHFKTINDSHGHHAGDGCLRAIALRVRNRLRTRDALGRYGGDELLVVMPDTRLRDGLAVAEQLRASVNCRPLAIDGLRLRASLSVGLAELAPGEAVQQLLERADAALYASKSAGRDRVSSGSHKAFDEGKAIA